VRRVIAFAFALGLTAALAPALRADDVFASRAEEDVRGTFAAGTAVPCTGGDIEPQALPDGEEGMMVPGLFLEPHADDLCRFYDVPLEAGVAYRRIRVEFDVYLDHWVTPIFHNVTSLRRSGRKKNERVLYYGLIVRGDNRKTVLDLGQEKMVKQEAPWQEGATYHIVLTADVGARRINLEVYQGEDLIQAIGGKATARELKQLTDRYVRVDFSSGGVADGAYFPPIGWQYWDLKITVERF
jgi:hypothetical protein